MRTVVPTLLLAAVLVPLFVPAYRSHAAVLTADTLWQGEVSLTDDLLVPVGRTLTIAPGTLVRVARAESSKTDPEYLSPLVEVTVRGTLRAAGEASAPIVFSSAEERKPGGWAGLLVDGGTVALRNCRIGDADAGLHLLNGTLSLHETTLAGNRYGLVLQEPGLSVQGLGNRITGNDYGLVAVAGEPPFTAIAEITGNRGQDMLTLPRREQRPAATSLPVTLPAELPLSRRYGDEVLDGETIWRGKVEVHGLVRVPVGSRLVIVPGTVVEFAEKDTNSDGIGENGLLIQGVIVAKGTPAAPIVFRSIGGKGRRGSWDAINIMNSDTTWNLIEHCRFEDAYRGLHFHFSRAAITDSLFTGSYRGIQFQESTVLLRGNRFVGNRSAVQGRDSVVTFQDNQVAGNWQGINFFRVNLVARGNRLVGNAKEGARIREGATVFEQNLVDGNRYGLMVMDAFYGSFARNGISNNGETGFSLKNTDNLEIAGNFIAGNGLSGMNLQEAGGRISGNLFSDNGEHGVGIQSFAGTLEENNFSGNCRYAIDLDGNTDVAAPRNWWGGETPEQAIFDRRDEAAKGRVNHGEPAHAPFLFAWPLATIDTGLVWRGDIAVEQTVTVAPAATLRVAPGARLFFAEGAGLGIQGRLLAQGEPAKRIVFSSLHKKKPGAWDEIHLENANGSTIAHCLIEYATWGVHSHFTLLAISDTVIRRNHGGIRFRSGPLTVERALITENSIGIRDYRGNAVIRDSAITGNETGIFVREEGGGLTVTGNNIFANSSYNLRLGDFNDEDVAAADNWWGEGDPLDTIFDGRQEPGIGMVRFEPFRRTPAPLTLPDSAGQ